METVTQILQTVFHQSPAFYAGAALVVIYQSSRYAEVGRTEALAGRYLTALGVLQARDFTDRKAYRASLALYVATTLLIYYLFCRFPAIIGGLSRIFQVQINMDWLNDQNIYPLYVAALLVGIAQPVVPVFPKFFNNVRIFCQDRANVPHGLNQEIDDWLDTIRRRCGKNRRELVEELRRLTDVNWNQFRRNADISFFDERYKKVEAGRQLNDLTYQDVMALIESTLTIAGVALIRKSGPRFSIIRERIDAPGAGAPNGSTLAYLWGSAFLFLLLSICIWQAVAHLNGAVAYLADTGTRPDFWPDDLEFAIKDIAPRIPTTVAPLLLTICLWRNSFKTSPTLDDHRLNILSPRGILDNSITYMRILFWCIFLGILLGWLVQIYNYTTYNQNPHLGEHYFGRLSP